MLRIAVIADGRYVGLARRANGEWPLVIRRIKDGNTIASWDHPKGWRVDRVGVSANSKYVGVVLDEDPVSPLPGYRLSKQNLRIGLIGPEVAKLDWVLTLSGKKSEAQSIRQVRPSDDGGYVALAGWYYGAAVIDIRGRALLWVNRPKEEVGMVDVAFSPDQSVVYAGGGEGCVYGMETTTGRIKSRWFATKSGRSEYGQRISKVAVSPDGRFVVAGTGPDGIAYVWERQTGRRVRSVTHGHSTILAVSFSPDSSAVATFVPGSIKVWGLPHRSGAATRTTAPARMKMHQRR